MIKTRYQKGYNQIKKKKHKSLIKNKIIYVLMIYILLDLYINNYYY